jgi:hypothetical protein
MGHSDTDGSNGGEFLHSKYFLWLATMDFHGFKNHRARSCFYNHYDNLLNQESSSQGVQKKYILDTFKQRSPHGYPASLGIFPHKGCHRRKILSYTYAQTLNRKQDDVKVCLDNSA